VTSADWIFAYLLAGVVVTLASIWRQHKRGRPLTFGSQLVIALFWLPLTLWAILLRRP